MTFADLVGQLLEDFSGAALPVDVGQWQGLDIKGDRSKVTWELREAILQLRMPDTMNQAQREYSPNLPWAEDHFQERVGGKPLNPPPSNKWWPFAQAGHADHLKDGQFSHTYPERFWPKHAGQGDPEMVWNPWDGANPEDYGNMGIRFPYGDLLDVVSRLIDNPLTRQAYLPVWFPEDTGAPTGERVPCTLGYLFMIREGKLHVTYNIRACDFMRHFRDDVYMAVRLGQWVLEHFMYGAFLADIHEGDITMGDLTMHISSFHIFEGDRAMVEHLRRQAKVEKSVRLRKALG
jgi:hypothetical protein